MANSTQTPIILHTPFRRQTPCNIIPVNLHPCEPHNMFEYQYHRRIRSNAYVVQVVQNLTPPPNNNIGSNVQPATESKDLPQHKYQAYCCRGPLPGAPSTCAIGIPRAAVSRGVGSSPRSSSIHAGCPPFPSTVSLKLDGLHLFLSLAVAIQHDELPQTLVVGYLVMMERYHKTCFN